MKISRVKNLKKNNRKEISKKTKKPKPNLVEFIKNSPMAGLSLSFEREQDFS